MPHNTFDDGRIAKYEDYENVYRGKHARVFDLDGEEQFPNVIVNIINGIIDGLSGLVASRSPTFELSTRVAQARVDEIVEASSFGTEILQFVTQGLLYGDSVFKIFTGADGQVKIRCVSPKRWYAIPDPDDADTIIQHDLFSIRKDESIKLILIESHTAGFITNTAGVISDGKIIRPATPAEVERIAPDWLLKAPVIETQVDEPLVVSWSHDKLCGELYGTSEMVPIWDLIRTLDQRATQEDRVLTKHADPKLILEEGTFERDADGNLLIHETDVIMVPQGSDKDKLGYITWDGKLEAVDRQINRLVEQQLHITQVSRLLLNADKTQAQTGEAFKVQLFPSILKATTIQKSLEAPIRAAIRTAQKLANATSGRKFTPSPVKIKWGVDLPSNIQSDVQAEVQAVEAGLKTSQEARRALDEKKEL